MPGPRSLAAPQAAEPNMGTRSLVIDLGIAVSLLFLPEQIATGNFVH